MIIDKANKVVEKITQEVLDRRRKEKNHMKLDEAEFNQLAVFDDLISESENRKEHNEFRKAKKLYVKLHLQDKYFGKK